MFQGSPLPNDLEVSPLNGFFHPRLLCNTKGTRPTARSDQGGGPPGLAFLTAAVSGRPPELRPSGGEPGFAGLDQPNGMLGFSHVQWDVSSPS